MAGHAGAHRNRADAHTNPMCWRYGACVWWSGGMARGWLRRVLVMHGRSVRAGLNHAQGAPVCAQRGSACIGLV